MSSGGDAKGYGLILPKSKQSTSKVASAIKPGLVKSSVFGNDSSSNSESESTSTDWMKKKLHATGKVRISNLEGHSGGMKKQTKMKVAAALQEDPTVYQYDEVYDQIEATKEENNAARKSDKQEKKPRYIHTMIKHAERQKREHERRLERQVQKEREAEGEQFADKDKFVTSAYRKKMEEMAKLDQEEERIERIEKALDVTGQRDMSGFYRHLYRQTMGQEKCQKLDGETPDTSMPNMEIKKISSEKREYRKRDSSNKSESNSEKDVTSEDSSSDPESSEGENENDKTNQNFKPEEVDEKELEGQRIEKEEARRQKLKQDKDRRERRKRRIELGQDTSSEESETEKTENEVGLSNKISLEKNTHPKSENSQVNENEAKTIKKPKVDIWKKVTVGDVFEAALQRYLIRKSSRTIWP